MLEIHPDGIIGHSTGELICAYADGCCTAEQTILSAYWRGKAVESAGLEIGAMAAVGLTWEEAVQRCPKGVYPACDNAEDSVTISGLKEPLEKFVKELQQENIFARVVNAYGYAFHCEHVWPAAKILKKVLLDLIPKPQPRTKRWISSSYPKDQWNTEDCELAGAEYFVHNLMSTVRFRDVLEMVPSDAVTIEISPHFLLQSILKRAIGSDAIYIGLMKRNDNNNIGFFLESLGKLYMEGLNPKIEKLYKPVKFPVPRSTPMICDIMQWDHSQSFEVPTWKPSTTSFVHTFYTNAADSYLLDHFIDGRSLFPATGYVFLAWKALCKKLDKRMEDINVVLEDFKIHKATIISSANNVEFDVTILDSSGTFEIIESNFLVASGKIYSVKNVVFSESPPEINKESTTYVSGDDIYNEIKIHGYQYGPAFQKLQEITLNGSEGFVEWENWISFMDALLLFYMFSEKLSSFILPTGALSFKICPGDLMDGKDECREKGFSGLPVNFHADTKVCRTIGLEIKSLEVDVAPKHAKADNSILEEYLFLPYIHKFPRLRNSQALDKYLIACNKVIDEIRNIIKPNPSHGKFSIKSNIDFPIDSYIKEANGNHDLLLALKEIANPQNIAENRQCKAIFKEYLQSIGQDLANTLLIDEYCLKFMFDIISENNFRKLNVLEINTNFSPILPTVVEVVEKYSVAKFKSKIIIADKIEDFNKEKLSNLKIQLHSLETLASVAQPESQDVVIGAILVSTREEAQQRIHLLSSVMEQKGFMVLLHKNSILPPEDLMASLSSETIDVVPHSVLENMFEKENLVVVSKISDEIGGNMYLLRYVAEPEPKKIIQVSESEEWLKTLKSTVCETSETSWVISQDNPYSGVIGMVNCLRHEPGGNRIRCVYIPQRKKGKNSPPKFSLEDRFYQEVLKKNLVMNVYKEGTWGSFRHIRTEKELQDVEVDYSFVHIKKYGDLSSLTWTESNMKYMENVSDSDFVHIYYSALNFRDVMLATGKISSQTAAAMSGRDICVLGLEYSGKTKLGQRVAGICASRGLATVMARQQEMSFEVPDNWSLEEAASVSTVYCTCYYALIMRADLQPGESILIHSGAGGIGIAAISIALSMNCEVYTTVGTEKKRQYLLETFPSLKGENIGCSRNTTFENMIMKSTKGRGVDVVLNSLADDKFLASIRCVAKHGRFVELGKYDLALNNKIGLKFFLKNITFHAVFVDVIVESHKLSVIERMMKLLQEGIRTGVVKPLRRTVFQRDEAEKAFRYMASGKHIGKVLLKIRDEEEDKCTMPQLLRLPAIPHSYFYPSKVYIIIGGLGGFGIEVSKWLLEKGARNLVLTTRYGARTPYHKFCLKRWKEDGYNVIVSTRNVSKKEEASKLLKEVSEIGPVGGIFNSAVVLHDAFLENTNWEDFKEVCAPKADATINLDALSRCLCPELDHFVCFSSISCGKGNAGQMNYGYANSVMERVCEQRVADGFPGLAIQWGIIGEVGVVHRHMGDDAMIAGVGAQKVQSCLNILEVSCQMKRPVVSSYVIKDSLRKQGNQVDTLQQISRLFGFQDVSEFNSTRNFGEMGVDSMTGIEMKQLIEARCDITLSMQEIQELKIDDVKALIEQAESQKMDELSSSTLVSTMSCVNIPKSCVHLEAVERLNDVASGIPVFIIDIDSSDMSQLRKLSATIHQPVFGLLLSKESPMTDVQSLAMWFLDRIRLISTKGHIIAHSSASVIALEMALLLQKSGNKGFTLTILDGAFVLTKIITNKDAKSSSADILCELMENCIPSSTKKLQEQLSNATSLQHQIRIVVEFFIKSSNQALNKTELTEIIDSYVKKIQILEAYVPKEKLCEDLLIIEDSAKLLANDVAELKMLVSELCSGKVTIQRVPEITTFSEGSIEKINSVLQSILV